MNQLNSEETNNVSGIPPFVLGLVDFCLLNAAFFALNWWKRGSFDLSPIYVKLLIAFYGIWIIVSLSTKKFRLREYEGLRVLHVLNAAQESLDRGQRTEGRGTLCMRRR